MDTAVFDLSSDEATQASARALDAETRQKILRAVIDANSGDNDAAILARVRALVAAHDLHATPVGVLFRTDEGGEIGEIYLDAYSGVVLYADGYTTDEVDFSDLQDLFGDEFGYRSRDFTLAVDLRTGEFDADDYGETDIHARFRIDKPGPATRTRRHINVSATPAKGGGNTQHDESVHTWADAFGRWHARIEFPSPGILPQEFTANAERLRAKARRVIRTEITRRETVGTGWQCRVERAETDERVGYVHSVTFREVTEETTEAETGSGR